MKKIRHNVFETNSSSSHSISLSDTTTYTSITPNEEGQIVLNGGEFGWGYESYTDPESKASYFAVDNFHNKARLAMLERVVIEHTGVSSVMYNFSLEYQEKNWSYIDHQSSGTTDVIKTEQDLKTFIFSRNSILTIDNDNH